MYESNKNKKKQNKHNKKSQNNIIKPIIEWLFKYTVK